MRRLALLFLAILALATVPGTPWSGADFTAGSASAGNTLATAADFNTVAVSMGDPGSPLKGTVTLTSTATSDRGVASVRYESSPAGGGTWTTACQATSAPFSCDWSTTAVADGPRDLRAVATDSAGYQRASAVVASRRVDNTQPAVTLNDPGAYLSGTASLTATASDTGGSGVASLTLEHRAPGGSWTTLCTGATSPRTCGLNTTSLAEGARELRAVATDAAGNQRIAALTRTVDNVAPAVALPALGAVRGTITVPVDASDAGTGVASVRVQILLGGTWTDACTDTAAPWECAALDTNGVADGIYQVRAIARDGASRETTSATTNVRIDNTAPSTATLADPGAYLRGSVALSGTAADTGSGVASWTVQYRPTGGSTWTDACTDAASPYGCSWATTSVADGTYDLRALVTDAAGNSAASAVVTNRRVDNTAPHGASIATTNGGIFTGWIESGDTLTFTYSEPIAPASLLGGWTGSSRAISVNVVNSGTNDRMELLSGGTRINLVAAANDLELGGDFVASTTSLSATMTLSGATVTVRFTQGGGRRAAAGTLKWTPSSAATDLAGNAALTNQVTESGTSDRDF